MACVFVVTLILLANLPICLMVCLSVVLTFVDIVTAGVVRAFAPLTPYGAPPARMCGGWTCFLAALGFIGLLTALIGDLAAHTGCCLGLLRPLFQQLLPRPPLPPMLPKPHVSLLLPMPLCLPRD